MSPPICEHNTCICYQLDYIAMYKVLKKRCIEFHKELVLKSNQLQNISPTVKKILKNTAVNDNTLIFVGKNGTYWEPSKVNEIEKE